jgi:hypothetical protein
VCDEGAKLANVNGGYPNLGDQTGDKETSEGPNVVFVGLDPGGGNELDLVGIGDRKLTDEGSDDIAEGPGVGGGLDDDGIGRAQVLPSPVMAE